MNRLHIIPNPTKLSEMKFDEFDFDNSDSWIQRGRRLQARRWRQLNRKPNGNWFTKHFRGDRP